MLKIFKITVLVFENDLVQENESSFQKFQQFSRLRYLYPPMKLANSEDILHNVVGSG